MHPSLEPHARRAESTIRSTWRDVAGEFTLGWGGPIEAYEERFPFVTAQVRDIRRRISEGLPLLTYQTRQDPPESMVVAVPHEDHHGRYNCRLLSAEPLTQVQVSRLNQMSQAIWFLLDQAVLPPWTLPGALEDRLVEWTGRELLEL